MSWFTKKPKEPLAVDEAISKLEEARKTRRSAMLELLTKLDEIPVEDGLTVVGKVLTERTKEGGH